MVRLPTEASSGCANRDESGFAQHPSGLSGGYWAWHAAPSVPSAETTGNAGRRDLAAQLGAMVVDAPLGVMSLRRVNRASIIRSGPRRLRRDGAQSQEAVIRARFREVSRGWGPNRTKSGRRGPQSHGCDDPPDCQSQLGGHFRCPRSIVMLKGTLEAYWKVHGGCPCITRQPSLTGYGPILS